MERLRSSLVPLNRQGTEINLMQTIEVLSEVEAMKSFAIARSRLLSPGTWHEFAGPLTAEFILVDKQSKEKKPPAEANDYLKIDIPAPGPKAGNNYDWVGITDIREAFIGTTDESVGIQLKPCAAPINSTDDTAHFFTEDASSTLIIQRQGKILHAFYYGRNEIPNTENVGILDKVRNILVATSAIAGISEMQWTALLKGLVS